MIVRTSVLCLAILAFPASPPAGSASPAPDSSSAGSQVSRAVPLTWPKIDGWKLSDGPTTYDSDALFQYIDGAAPAFLSADFEELTSATYADQRGGEVTVDVYRHSSAVRAFGMYTQERPAGTTPIPVGIEGYGGADYLNFVLGSYYVKTRKHGAKNVALRSFADRIAVRLAGPRNPPAVLKSFPVQGKLDRAEKFTAHDFLGYSFFHDAVSAPYQIAGAQFRLFVIQASDAAEVQKILKLYVSRNLPSGSDIKPAGSVVVKDPLNGLVDLSWRGSWLWGAVDDACPVRATLLDELGRNLPATP